MFVLILTSKSLRQRFCFLLRNASNQIRYNEILFLKIYKELMFDMDLENVFIVVRTTKSFLYAQIIKTRNSQEKKMHWMERKTGMCYFLCLFLEFRRQLFMRLGKYSARRTHLCIYIYNIFIHIYLCNYK